MTYFRTIAPAGLPSLILALLSNVCYYFHYPLFLFLLSFLSWGPLIHPAVSGMKLPHYLTNHDNTQGYLNWPVSNSFSLPGKSHPYNNATVYERKWEMALWFITCYAQNTTVIYWETKSHSCWNMYLAHLPFFSSCQAKVDLDTVNVLVLWTVRLDR